MVRNFISIFFQPKIYPCGGNKWEGWDGVIKFDSANISPPSHMCQKCHRKEIKGRKKRQMKSKSTRIPFYSLINFLIISYINKSYINSYININFLY